ncbi:unnamed protein product [Rhodiola kirilowii]
MTGTNLFSTYASLTGTLMLLRSMFNDFIPIPLRNYLIETFRKIFKKTSPDHMTLVVDERTGYNKNHVYEAAETYLRTIINPTVDRLKVSKTPRQNKLTISIEKNQTILDTYEGIKITWKFINNDKYYFEIVFEKKFKEMVLGSYLSYVMSRFNQIKKEDKVVRLYTRGCSMMKYSRCDKVDEDDENTRGDWVSVRLEHPVTFDKMAMEPEQKKMIIDDLDRFVSRTEFYQRTGKVWKRGYLLYGPPGTGKSSLIAAMANYLKYDIYDLELSEIHSDSYLRSILMSTTNRSILIIEDIDCNDKAQDRALKVDRKSDKELSTLTLSGLLNFIDGLWSSCGDERIIVFTTNHKEKLDQALLRPGRMDVHIHMSYCTPAGFKILASNYLDVKDTHPLFEEIEKLMILAKVTPAEVAEELMRSEDPEIALDGVLNLLKRKIIEEEQREKNEKEKQVEKVSEISVQTL